MFVFKCFFFFFFFNDTATTEIYTLSLHDALPISGMRLLPSWERRLGCPRQSKPASSGVILVFSGDRPDRKSTRLNSSHLVISYAVFCLKKKKKRHIHQTATYSTVQMLCRIRPLTC